MITGKLLVANRGEIAARIARAAAELGLPSVAVYPADDAASLHTRKADEAVQLPGRGVAAYLDGAAVIQAAKDTGATAIHPGYGFLSENAGFARACAEAGITFVGPAPESLELFGDKHAARALAAEQDVPTLPGTAAPTSLEEARAFLKGLGPNGAVMVKAVAGGGGRGMRPVLSEAELEEAFTRCQSEALSGFGNGDVFVERLVRRARHIEVQVVGDGQEVSHLWERDCSLQRRRQKIVEIAPAPTLDPVVRDRLLDAALRLTGAVNYKNLCTVEFLVDAETGEFFFIEANPRLQVEHTVTEEVTGLNLVEVQLQIAGGQTLAELGLRRDEVPTPRGIAVQLRVNTETMQADGEAKPGGGTLSAFEPPSGRGIRVDSYGYAGYRTNPAYDSLLAKLIVHTASKSLPDAMTKAYRALCEFHVAGVPTNIPFLQALLREEAVKEGRTDTDYIGANAARLVEADHAAHPHLFFSPTTEAGARRGRAGAKVDSSDPLAVLAFGQAEDRQGAAARAAAEENLGEGMVAVRTPLQGTIISLSVAEGDVVPRGAQLAVMEAMKMEHEIKAETAGIVRAIHAEAGDTMWEDQLLIALEPSDAADDMTAAQEEIDLDYIRPDLAEVLERKSRIYDENRPQAVARRRKTGHRTARENVYDMVNPETFIEYGSMVVAAQVRRRGLEDLYARSPADGIIVGVGQVNEDQFGDPESRVVVLAYDYTVFAGTQGVHNHWKTDKGIDIADDGKMPVILFAEGGGGRPGDDDYGGFVGMDTFHHFMKLSGHVPIVCIVAGRCFAGNASLVGASDVVIATRDANIGMGGPAMVEGGGLGVFAPEDIGPTDVQSQNGVIDVLVEDEAEAVQVAKKYLSYFQGSLKEWKAPDQRRMRQIVPENRLRIYEIRDVIETLADEGSVLELRKDFGKTIVTCLIRIEGRAVGVIANDPKHLGGAIESDGADKGARFMQICDAFDIPIVHLCDTPGIMVGPEIEKTALVRHAARMFVTSANLSVPYFTVITRKAYGLGQSAMAGGNLRFPYFYIAWPTGEFAPMGIEGQVKLGYRAELEACEDPEERRQLYEKLVNQLYESGKAINRTANFSLDEVIDPADTRKWVVNLLASIRRPPPDGKKRRPMIDSW